MKFEKDRKWLFNKTVEEHTERSLKNQEKDLEEAKEKLLTAKDEKEKDMWETRIAFLEENIKEKKQQKLTTGFHNWGISLLIGLSIVVAIAVLVGVFVFN